MNGDVVRLVIAGALLALGAGLLIGAASPPRRSLADELRVLDGRPALAGRQRRRTALGLVATTAILLLPLWAALLGMPVAVVVVAALAVAGIASALFTELRLVLRGRGRVIDAPLTFGWQRRLAARLVSALTATRPVPPLRPVMRTRPERPTAPATSRNDVRLLVVRLPAEAEGLRLWDLASAYLGSTLRYRDLLALNRERTGPGGVPITEDSVIGHGWTLLVPGDARGPGLVRLPASVGLALAGAAEVRPGPEPVVSSEAEPEVPSAAKPEVPSAVEPVILSAAEPAILTEAQPVEPVGSSGSQPVVVGTIPDTPPTVTAQTASPARRTTAGGRHAKAEPPDDVFHPRAELSWDLVHARLLSDGLLDTLDGLRERRVLNRPEGAGVPLPDMYAAVVEESAHVGADRSGGAFLEVVLRLLASGLAQRDVPPPQIVAAHLADDLLELRLAAPDRHPPAPFEATESGGRWLLDRAVVLVDVPDVAPQMPALVSLGSDGFGRLLINLPAGGLISLEGPESGCRMVALSMAAELVTKRWSEAPLVNLVGFGSELADFSPRLRLVDRASRVLEGPLRGDVVFLAEPPTDAVLTALRVGEGSDWFGAPTVVVIGADHRARWRLQLGDQGALTCPELNFTVGAQALAPSTAAALARLTAAERSTQLAGVRSSTVLLAGPVEFDAVEVLVRLFGPPRLERGGREEPATARTVELVSYLTLFGASTRDAVAAALWPGGVGDGELAAALADVAATLGVGRDGELLLRIGSELIQVAVGVQPDWHLFVAAAAGGADAVARALVGTFLQDPRAGLRHYSWMARLPIARQLPGLVADVTARQDRALDEEAARRPPPPRITMDIDAPPTEPALVGRSS